jgi:MFS transporter, DHA1 family, inner membrane transport protein
LTAISLLLVVFGVASAIGSIAGGRASDRWPRATLPFALAILALVLVGLGVLRAYPLAVIPLLFLWGVAGFLLSPALQARVIAAAGPGNTLASSLNISAFNVGIACGSLLGTAVVAAGGLSETPFVATGLACLATVPALLGSRQLTFASSEPGLTAAATPAVVAAE